MLVWVRAYSQWKPCVDSLLRLQSVLPSGVMQQTAAQMFQQRNGSDDYEELGCGTSKRWRHSWTDVFRNETAGGRWHQPRDSGRHDSDCCSTGYGPWLHGCSEQSLLNEGKTRKAKLKSKIIIENKKNPKNKIWRKRFGRHYLETSSSFLYEKMSRIPEKIYNVVDAF